MGYNIGPKVKVRGDRLDDRLQKIRRLSPARVLTVSNLLTDFKDRSNHYEQLSVPAGAP